MGRDFPNDCITENGQNTEKSPGDLRLAVTPVKNIKKKKKKKKEKKKNILPITMLKRIWFCAGRNEKVNHINK